MWIDKGRIEFGRIKHLGQTSQGAYIKGCGCHDVWAGPEKLFEVRVDPANPEVNFQADLPRRDIQLVAGQDVVFVRNPEGGRKALVWGPRSIWEESLQAENATAVPIKKVVPIKMKVCSAYSESTSELEELMALSFGAQGRNTGVQHVRPGSRHQHRSY